MTRRTIHYEYYLIQNYFSIKFTVVLAYRQTGHNHFHLFTFSSPVSHRWCRPKTDIQLRNPLTKPSNNPYQHPHTQTASKVSISKSNPSMFRNEINTSSASNLITVTLFIAAQIPSYRTFHVHSTPPQPSPARDLYTAQRPQNVTEYRE